ncbi:hypothetical protein A2164_04615 [Candidatus Curtissbacteria bacterium RBG_13_35_7]|uniref:Peptidase S11 D-alanyl-D-alanine carboxypeptidase A N-terminal domain-containing protein n=1 Tax=Candidatus Curtissbacteria bacterium RBG_13_35_7 TaxID=1797705 RepID=A0A1F5G0K2_9BACT|nr:MAG: hypothetical protein A2164_04615 [Candidatus Curtissbacteria bacterium RBG_13_35_7]
MKFLLRKKVFNFEKRIFLIFVMVLAIFVILNKGQNHNIITNDSPIEKNIAYLNAINKIRGEVKWLPYGEGAKEEIRLMPKIQAGAVVNLESGQVLWSKNLNEKIAPASLSKLATVMTALDIAESDQTIDISESAATQIPTNIGLKTTEKLTLDEAVAASILTSANDACEAVAQTLGSKIGDGTADFMKLVNLKLTKIGVEDSYFETSTGLDSKNHYSTVYDLAIIAHEVKVNYSKISTLASLDYYNLPKNNNHKLYDLPNWNALLGTYPGVDGLKIGYTEKAGHTTLVTATRGDTRLIAIVIGAQSLEDREIAAATLLNFGFNKYGISEFPINQLNLVKRFNEWKQQLSLAR